MVSPGPGAVALALRPDKHHDERGEMTPRDNDRGRPQRFADRAGGPAVMTGMTYQIAVATMKTLTFLRDASRFPADGLAIRPEMRFVVPGGQLGYDFGWSGGSRTPDECWEIKFNPNLKDARDFVVGLAWAPSNADPTAVRRLVAGHETSAVGTLRRVIRLAHEAVDEEHFAVLVETAGTPSLKELVALAGDTPKARLMSAEDPHQLSELLVTELIETALNYLATPGTVDALRNRVEAELREATMSRRVIVASTLARRLLEEGLLNEPPVVDYESVPTHTLNGFAVLQRCKMPLPPLVLAAALGVDESSLGEILSDLVTVQRVIHSSWGWSAEPTAMAPLVVDGLNDRLRDGLNALIMFAQRSGGRPEVAAAQTPNALALAGAVLNTDPRIVSGVFIAFDKPSKAWGDLSAIQGLAQLASEAARRVASSDLDPKTTANMASVRARSNICGTGWVYQRVDELTQADAEMVEAEQFSNTASDPKDKAFAVKCRGRLSRLRAEDLDVADPLRAALLDASVAQLTEAQNRFTALMVQGDIGVNEDLGECLALVARTHATRMDWEAAKNAAQAAHRVLDSNPGAKAYADLLVLEAEIAGHEHRERQRGGLQVDGADVRAHLDRLDGLRTRHLAGKPPGPRTRVASEIVARIVLAKASLHRVLGEADEARTLYSEAEDLYDALAYPVAKCRATWESVMLRPDPLPVALVRALDSARVDIYTRAIAVEEYDSWQASRANGSMANLGLTLDIDAFWSGLISRAVNKARVSRPRWGDGRLFA